MRAFGTQATAELGARLVLRLHAVEQVYVLPGQDSPRMQTHAWTVALAWTNTVGDEEQGTILWRNFKNLESRIPCWMANPERVHVHSSAADGRFPESQQRLLIITKVYRGQRFQEFSGP